jgi:RiboL-PSP-HEPN
VISTDTTLSPRQAFEDNIRPADLLLRVYRLLENDTLHTDTELVRSLRSLVGADSQEELVLVYNEIFLGLVREGAQMPGGTLRRPSLNHLLRQSVVAASTALETYLPSLLRANLPVVIECQGREFVPRDKNLQNYLKDLRFSLSDTLRLIGDPDAPLFIANKLLGFINFKYLAGKQGIHAVGTLLGLEDPWEQISTQLARDRAGLEKLIEDTTKRRNDIVHRADRSQSDPGGDAQEIGYAWSKQAVDTISHVCFALDELVAMRMVELKEVAERTEGA